ncbi:helix-turn-helix domain-containing protein [Bacillus sp. JJ1474]
MLVIIGGLTEKGDRKQYVFLPFAMLQKQAIRFSTLEAICKALDCQPGDILEYKNDEDTKE